MKEDLDKCMLLIIIITPINNIKTQLLSIKCSNYFYDVLFFHEEGREFYETFFVALT